MRKPAKQALINYFKGNSPADEQEAIELYLAMDTDPEYVELCLKEAMAEADAITVYPLQQDRAWQAFIKHTEHGALPIAKKRRTQWLAYAAAIALFILSATAISYLKQAPSLFSAKITYQRIRAGYGKIDKITLPDSSHLVLFPGTVIDIPGDYNKANRKIFLTGRAYFEVAHNRQKPFYVLTHHLTTRVLGTSFEVNAAKGASTASVILRTGRVSVSNKHKHLAFMSPGQKFSILPPAENGILQPVQTDKLLTWTNGELTFDQTSFAEICNQLETWYNLNIQVKNKQLLQKKITASFKSQSSTQVLDILSATAGFKYTSQNGIIHIY